jgi:hypothetical protein
LFAAAIELGLQSFLEAYRAIGLSAVDWGVFFCESALLWFLRGFVGIKVRELAWPFVSGSALSFETLMHLALDLVLVDFC